MLCCLRHLLIWTVLNCCAGWAWAQVPVASSEPAVAEALPLIVLNRESGRVSLNDVARVWIDHSGKADLNAAVAAFEGKAEGAEPHLRRAGESHLLHGKAMWLQFRVLNLNVPARWALQIELPTTDMASMFYRREDGSWVQQQAGDALPHSQWTEQDRYPVFVLSELSSIPVTYYLRIEHQRTTYSAGINLYSAEEIISSRQIENLLLGIYLGISLAVVVVCLTNSLALRYANYWRYAIYVATLAMAQLAFLGLGTQYFSPELVAWNGVASYVLPSFSIVAALWFVRALLNPKRFAPWIDRWLLGLTLFFLCLAVVETFWPTMQGYRLSNALTLVSMLTLYLVFLRSWYLGDKNAALIALGFLPVVVAGLFPLARNFGLITTGFLSQYAVTVGSAMEIAILMFALMKRSSVQRDMRVREQALQQQDALTGLADERRAIAKIHSGILRARRFNHRMGLLHVQLANHDHLMREHGSKVANAALLICASHLGAVARDIDLAARLGEDHFMLVVEGPVTPARLVEVSTQLLARSLRPSDALPVGQLLKLQICAALLPDEQADSVGEDANTIYNWMLSQSELAHSEAASKAIWSINF
jgi:two-component system, sensor histidine kinase LadS